MENSSKTILLNDNRAVSFIKYKACKRTLLFSSRIKRHRVYIPDSYLLVHSVNSGDRFYKSWRVLNTAFVNVFEETVIPSALLYYFISDSFECCLGSFNRCNSLNDLIDYVQGNIWQSEFNAGSDFIPLFTDVKTLEEITSDDMYKGWYHYRWGRSPYLNKEQWVSKCFTFWEEYVDEDYTDYPEYFVSDERLKEVENLILPMLND